MYTPDGGLNENYIGAFNTEGDGDICISINNTIKNGDLSKTRTSVDHFKDFSDSESSAEGARS